MHIEQKYCDMKLLGREKGGKDIRMWCRQMEADDMVW